MTGNKNAWRAPLAGLASLAMIATMGVAASTAGALDISDKVDDPNKPNVTLDAGNRGYFPGNQPSVTVIDATAGEKGSRIDTTKIAYWDANGVASIDGRYTFTGWYTSPDAGSQKFDFDNTELTGDITLYAHWAQSPAVVEFNDGTAGQKAVTFDPTVTESAGNVTATLAPGDVLAEWQKPADTAGDHNLLTDTTWKNSDGQAVDLSKKVGGSLKLQPVSNPAVSVHFNASVNPNFSSSLDFAKDYALGSTLEDPFTTNTSKSLIVTAWATKNEVNAPVWDFANDKVADKAGDLTLYAVSSQAATRVTFHGYGDVYVANDQTLAQRGVTLKTPTPKGTFDYYFEFLGWDAESNYNENVDKPVTDYSDVKAGQLTVKEFYPEYKLKVEKTKDIYFDENWDEAPAPYKQSFETHSYFTAPTPKKDRPGYKFTGWNTQADGSGTDLTDDTFLYVPNASMVYAQWTKVADAPTNAELLWQAWGYPVVESTSAQSNRDDTDNSVFTEKTLADYKKVIKDIYDNDFNNSQRSVINNGSENKADLKTAFPDDAVAGKALAKIQAAWSKLEFNESTTVYRLYDQNSTTKHLYTTDTQEYQNLLLKGWRDETKTAQGRFSVAPYNPFKAKDNTQAVASGFASPVYRVYQKFTADGNYVNRHFYTSDEAEYKGLIAKGWRDEGIAWYSRNFGGSKVYRTYSASRYEHLYTSSKAEADKSVSNYGYRWDDKTVAFNSAD